MKKLFLFTFLVIFFMGVRGSPFQKGMSYLTWGNPLIDSRASYISLRNLKETGTEWIAVVNTYYQATINSTEIGPKYPQSYTDEGLSYFLSNATELGFKILLKPHVDPLDNNWRAWIGDPFTPSQWPLWFKSYNAFILKHAAIAEKFKVPLFCIGVEMISASSHEADWRSLIASVRKIYSGKITYAGNWGTKYQVTVAGKKGNIGEREVHGEIDDIKWLDALDIIGVDAYYFLTDVQDPSKQDLLDGWAPIVPHLANIAAVQKKSIIFTEIGYRSIEGAAIHPGWWNTTVPINITQQALCYEAVFDAFEDQKWWEGIYWWNWYANPNQGGNDDQDFTPQHKLAQEVVRNHYISHPPVKIWGNKKKI